MIISNIKKIKNTNDGFTLIELVIVISGLAALSSFAIPSYMNTVKLNKAEQAKAIVNGYAADCLSQYRLIKDSEKQNFIETARPTQLNNAELATLGYKVDGDKNKCSELSIKPSNDKEDKLFQFGFNLEEDSRTELVSIRKTAEPSQYTGSKRFLNSCEGWAGDGCGLSEAQKEEFARKAVIAKNKAACLTKYNKWLSDGSSGGFSSWDSEKQTCTRDVYAFEGIPVSSKEAVDQALKNKYGRACSEWRASKKNTISPNGKPETLNPECGGVNYWFHSGYEFTTQASWTAHDNLLKQQLCISNRAKALQSGKGEYTYNPAGPPPCGKVVWFCNGKEYETLEAYKTTTCGAAPDPEELERIRKEKEDQLRAKRCANFRPHGYCKGRPNMRNHPMCKCQ